MARLVLRGKVRLSTVVLAAVFLITLSTYLLVRPVPASIADTGPPPTPGSTSQAPKTSRSPEPSRAPTTVPPSITGSGTPAASPTPSVTRGAPSSTPPASASVSGSATR